MTPAKQAGWNSARPTASSASANSRRSARLWQRLSPPVACGLLAGSQRAVLLARGQWEAAVLPVQALKPSERSLLLNSVRGMVENHRDQ